MLERLFDTVGSLGGPWAYLAVALLAAGESSIGVGLVVPGETGMIVGGFIVSQGNAELGMMMVVAVAGAIIGDSLGYEIGRHFGPALRRTRIGRAMGEERWEQAEAYLRTRGGRAIFFARFVAVVRSLVPALAGVTGMPYRRFLLYNALGGTLWATIYVLIGFFAGRSYDQVASAIEGAGWIVLVLLLVVALIVVAGRWISAHPERVRAGVARLVAWGPVAWVRRTFPRSVAFVQGRFRLNDAFGLSLTIGLAFLVVTGWVFGMLVDDVTGREGLVRVDRPVAEYLADHRADGVTTTMEGFSTVGDVGFLVAIVVVAGGAWLIATRRWSVLLFLAVALGGALILSGVVKELVARPRPPGTLRAVDAGGLSFPSGHAVHATTLFLALAYLHGAVVRHWRARVVIWLGACSLALFVGFSRVYLGVHWLTDVLGGHALGAVWVAVVATAFGASTRVARRAARNGPAPPETDAETTEDLSRSPSTPGPHTPPQ
ncbi:MAG TPA: bifunctional DedA family/phosphatase PAP2 family protein [Acidimicrobiia bacterium]|nr:bifunctional DedA family/phosphatase PAP2 family protein [Acidimicrobiia bacterium]